MRLTKDKKILLVAVPRTRSQWLWKSLEGELFEDVESFFELNSVSRSVHQWRKTWPPHTPNRSISRELLIERHTYEKFTVMRNPWERYASFYSRLRKPLETGAKAYAKKTQDASAENKHSMSNMAMQLSLSNSWFKSQLEIVPLMLHQLYRSSLITTEASTLITYLGLKRSKPLRTFSLDEVIRLKTCQSALHKGNGVQFTPVTKRIIESLCEIEIEQFGFSFD